MRERSASADLQMLESLLAQWRRGEFWDAEPYADDVVFVVSGPEGGEYHGLEGLGFAWRNFLSAWEDFRIEAERVVPGREGLYVLLMRNIGRGKGSGLEIDADVANLVTVREGKIARLEMFWDRDAALHAAGVGQDEFA
jgi:ketosteroid isomerase-like protein